MLFCDLECKYAKFPKSGRTFVALYCKKKKTLVHKNLPCKDKVEKK
jgi:hypothetical protein